MPSQPSPVVGSYQTYPAFTGIDNKCRAAVYLLPPQFTYDSPNTVTVGNVYLPPATPPSPSLPADFSLSWHIPAPAATSTAQLTITVKNVNQWKCAPDARASVRASFAALAVALDAMEFPDPGSRVAPCLVPGATALILRAVAEIMPAPLAESLFYYYGLNTGTTGPPACPYVDLMPGMRLAVQPGAYQFTGAGQPANGYIPAGEQHIPVGGVLGADGFRRVSFDAFLGLIAPPKIANQPVGPSSPQVAIAGVLDLASAATARRWYRLLYPAELSPAAGPEDFQLGDSVTLVGAETRGDLEAATTAFQAGQPAVGARAPLIYSVLRGRPSIVPQVAIQVFEARQWVPLGTTVRDVVEAYYPSNPLLWDSQDSPSQQFQMLRALNELPSSQQTVTVSFNPLGTPLADPRVYELPVIQGDTITVPPNPVQGR